MSYQNSAGQKIDQAHVAGIVARRTLAARSTNPYPVRSATHRAWDNAWTMTHKRMNEDTSYDGRMPENRT